MITNQSLEKSEKKNKIFALIIKILYAEVRNVKEKLVPKTILYVNA